MSDSRSSAFSESPAALPDERFKVTQVGQPPTATAAELTAIRARTATATRGSL
jgi:hypothetical protein